MDFDALWQQALAPTLAAAGEDGAAILGLHPGAKAELPFAGAFGWLVGAFHVPCKILRKVGLKKRRKISVSASRVNKGLSGSFTP